MGTLDTSNIKRTIKIVDLTGLTIAQVESNFNTNYGQKGWRIVQVIVGLGSKNYILAEKEE